MLWTAIQFAFKAPAFAAEHGVAGVAWLYLESFWEPFGTLWFIYLLPIFFVVTKLALSLAHPAAGGVARRRRRCEIAPIDTGWTVIDEFAARFVYFYTGYCSRRASSRLASYVQALPESAFAGLAAWALLNGLLVFYGFSELPFVSLALGLIGAIAVVAVSALMAKTQSVPSRCAISDKTPSSSTWPSSCPWRRAATVLIKGGWIADIGTISVLVTLAGVIGPVLLFWAVRHTPLRFLFARPTQFWLTTKPRLILQPAE